MDHTLFLCMLCNFSWKTSHSEYYNLITREIRYAPISWDGFVTWCMLQPCVFSDFAKLFVLSVCSLSHMVFEVFLTVACVEPVFERDFLAYEKKEKKKGQQRGRENHLSQSLQTGSVLETPPPSQVSTALPQPSLLLVLSLETGHRQKFFLRLFWACTGLRCGFQNSPLNMGTFECPSFPQKFPKIFCHAFDTLLYISTVSFCPRLLQLFLSLMYAQEMPAAFWLFCPEFQVRRKKDEYLESVLQVAPDKLDRQTQLFKSKSCSTAFRARLWSPKFQMRAAVFKTGTMMGTRWGKGKWKHQSAFLVFLGCLFLDSTIIQWCKSLTIFQSSAEVSSDSFCLIFQCFCGRKGMWHYLLYHFRWHHHTIYFWMI